MNQREAKQQGFNDGCYYQAVRNRGKSPDNMISEDYKRAGNDHANDATPYFKARNLYLQGWLEAWQEPKQPEPVKHFESRFDFCTCEACNAKRASL